MVTGGIVYALMAYLSSYFQLPVRMLTDALACLIAFVIPGHLLYANRKS